METFFLDVIGLVVRWLHLITGIAWVGASFYFIWLDNSLEEPPQWKKDKGIKGDLWSFHGGGIYEVAKYKVAPEKMPRNLHWFYWEAYSTWITGMCLMFAVYYLQAPSYLVDSQAWITTPGAAIAASLCFLAGGVLVNELLIRTPLVDRQMLFGIMLFVILCAFSWLGSNLFSARASYLHMGALVGCIMAANVFFGIIPPQRAFAKAVEIKDEIPDRGLQLAKLRSTHNNYFTLPVLFCMISNHYPVFYGHRYAWAILMAIFAITAVARHYFNLKHRGIKKPSILVICALTFIALCVAMAVDKQRQDEALAAQEVDAAKVQQIAASHCGQCHAPNPTFAGFSDAPLGMNFLTQEDFELNAEKALIAVSTNYMPLGNITQMTDEERQELLAWLSQL